jgi:hypothetical protein
LIGACIARSSAASIFFSRIFLCRWMYCLTDPMSPPHYFASALSGSMAAENSLAFQYLKLADQ